MFDACTDTLPWAWAVVNTHPHREQVALEHLSRQKFDAYCPMIRKRQRQAHRFVDVLRPLFPSYVFVRVAPKRDQWRPVLSTFGVRKLVRFGDQLGLIEDDFIENLRAREADGIVARPESPFKVGQDVHIQSGPFDGLVAKILAIDERDRMIVLLEMMRRQVHVQLRSDQLSVI